MELSYGATPVMPGVIDFPAVFYAAEGIVVVAEQFNVPGGDPTQTSIPGNVIAITGTGY